MTCTIYEDVCAACGERVAGGSDNGTLDVPAAGQVAVCLMCRLLGHKTGEEAKAPALHAAFRARADVRRGAGA